MRGFLRKMNRGVALAAVLLAGLIVFFIADSVAFAKEEPALKDFLEEYLQECAKANLLPEQYREPGVEVPGDVLEAKEKELGEFVEKYFTEYMPVQNMGFGYSSTKYQLLLQTGWIVRDNAEQNRVIQEMEYSLVSIASIRKQATNAVMINFKVNSNITASPGTQYIYLGYMRYHDDRFYYSRGHQENDDELVNESAENEFTFTLFKVNGEWKIGDSSRNWNHGGVRTVAVG